jgi:diketogulonate reductase-like aldo/keto reductase
MTDNRCERPSLFPPFIYGTAWKEDQTERLTLLALQMGFWGIDSANQRRHYDEVGVGNAVANVIKSGVKSRGDLFLQTKFTYTDGHDHRIPYDVEADYPTQVRQSFQNSLEHLQTDYIDSYVLHGPLTPYTLEVADWEVWKEMEDIHKEGGVRHLGISNISFDQLIKLLNNVNVKPTFVQNRCFAQLGWDIKVRRTCVENNIIYQGFSLLTANQFILSDPIILHIAESLGKTPAQVVFNFALQVGILPLTGTTSKIHMEQDLKCDDHSLSDDEINYIERIAIQQ